MRVQDLRDNIRDRQAYFYNKRGWSDYGAKFEWRWQFCFKRKIHGHIFACNATLGGEDERAVSLNFGFLWFDLYLTFVKLLPSRLAIGWYKRGEIQNPRWFDDSQGRQWGFYLYGNHLVFMWGRTVASGGSDWRKYGFYWSCFIDEKIFGRIKYEETNPKKFSNKEIWFPEGVYHINVTITEDTWNYKRWPWWPLRTVVPRAQIDVIEQGGIPIPGKGENSWDCGDTATTSMRCPATSLHEAIEKLRSSVNETRRKYGSGEAMYAKRGASPA